MSEKLYITCLGIFVIVFIIFGFWMLYKNFNLGSKESDYEILCLNNHEYFKASFYTKGYLSINLNDSGLPIKCKQ